MMATIRLIFCGLAIVAVTLVVGRHIEPTRDGNLPDEPLNPSHFEAAEKLVNEAELRKGGQRRQPKRPDDILWNDQPLTPSSCFDNPPCYQKADWSQWPNAQLIYWIDDGFTNDQKTAIAAGAALINDNTCVWVRSWRPGDNKNYYVRIFKKECPSNDPKCFVCNTRLGFDTSLLPYDLNLSEECFNPKIGGGPGTIAHEFMHSLGFPHEMSRSDRDKYLEIKWADIGKDWWPQYKIVTGYYGNSPGNADFDYESIMDYSRYGWNGNRRFEEMRPKTPYPDKEWRNTKFLTDADKTGINTYYRTECQKAGQTRAAGGSGGALRNSTECENYDDSECKRLASEHDYCTKKEKLMLVYCKKECGKCELGCVDADERCADWMEKGYCAKYPDYMEQFCEKSCATCV